MVKKWILCTWITGIFVLSVNGQDPLVGHWTFDETEGDTLYDETEYTNHGIHHGAKRITGILGNALYLDGKTAFAELTGVDDGPPAILSELGKGSISVWFKVDSIPTEYGIAPIFYYGMEEHCDFFDAANQGLIIELGHSPIFPGSKRLFFTIWNNGCTYPSFCFDTGFPVEEGKWHHFVAVVGEDYNTGYLDGEELVNRRYNFNNASASQFFEDALAHEKLWIGKGHWDRTTQYFNGAIDDIRVYNQPLSEEEVKELYYSGLGRTHLDGFSESQVSLRFYPNPTSQQVHFEVGYARQEFTYIRIMNVNGKIVLQRSVEQTNGMLDISHLPDGIYYAEIYGKGTSLRSTFLIHQGTGR